MNPLEIRKQVDICPPFKPKKIKMETETNKHNHLNSVDQIRQAGYPLNNCHQSQREHSNFSEIYSQMISSSFWLFLQLQVMNSLEYSVEPKLAKNENFKPKIKRQVKSPQSKFKNIYGLVGGRVIKSCKNYTKLTPEQVSNIKETSRYYYIHKQLNLLHSQDKKEFEKYLSQYNSENKGTTRNRGKSTLYKFLAKNQKYGLILLDLIQKFLDKENPDFLDYISDGKKPKKTSQVLNDEMNLEQLIQIFQDIRSKLEKEQNLPILKVEVKYEQ